jgi:hypothetical protein
MYVATVGPAEAYLIRQARLSTLPDPHRERGLPSTELEPDVWRGEISVGDSLVLVSPNVMAKLGAEELKDAMLTLHPQSAMEHLHQRFASAEGSGSDGAIAFEATEVSATSRQRTLVPVRPAEPLAGAPDRSPIPLADGVQAAGSAVSAAAGSARDAAGGALEKVVIRAQELLPHRKPAYRRVTPLSSRRETQRRAAVALLAFLVVFGGLGLGVWAFAGTGTGTEAISSINTGQAALERARANLEQVTGPGIDLIEADRTRAQQLLTEAYEQLDIARRNGIRASVIDPLREQAVTDLDRLYGVVPVLPQRRYTFQPKEGEAPLSLTHVVRGPDGATYAIETTRKAVYRIEIDRNSASAIMRAGQEARGTTIDTPKLLAVGGRDLLMLDAKNVLWRWRAANDEGRGTITRVTVTGASGWGDDIVAIGTFTRLASQGLYNLYVVDPSEQQILAFSPAADGGGFPAKSTGWLATTRQVSDMTRLHIDGDLFTVEDGTIMRFVSGKSEGWEPETPADTLLRPEPVISLIAGGGERRTGSVFGYDRRNRRIIELDKADGRYIAQYRLAGGVDGWEAIRDMYVVPAAEPDGPDTLVWITVDSVYSAVLEAVPDVAPATPAPSAPASGAPAASAAPATP